MKLCTAIPLFNYNGIIYTQTPPSNWRKAQFIIPLEFTLSYAFVCKKITLIKRIGPSAPTAIPLTVAFQPYCVNHLDEDWNPYIPVTPIETAYSRADIGTMPNYWTYLPGIFHFSVPPLYELSFPCPIVRNIWGDYSYSDIPIQIDIAPEYPHVFRSYYTEFDMDSGPYYSYRNGIMVYAVVVMLHSTSTYEDCNLFIEFDGTRYRNIDIRKEYTWRNEYLEVSP